MANKNAHSKAVATYNAKTYHSFTVNPKISEYEIIKDFASKTGMSLSKFMVESALYIINNNISLDNKEE